MPVPTGQSGSPGWRLELSVSGGIAGRDELLTVDSAGMATMVDRKSERSKVGRLASADLENIAGLLAGVEKLGIAGDGSLSSSRCRDCLSFRLVLRDAGKPRTVRLASDRLAGSPYRELIGALLDLESRLVDNER